MTRSLIYDKPARSWNEALPIGNGALGAMVFGLPALERLQLNEESLWHGGPRRRTNPDALAALPEVRRLVAAGRTAEAEDLAMLAMAGAPEHPAHYVPVGDLLLAFGREARPEYGIEAEGEGGIEGYRRELDLETAIAAVSYRRDGVFFERECFASAPDAAIVARIRSGARGAVSCRIRLSRGRCAGAVRHEGPDILEMTGEGGGEGGVRFAAAVRAIAEGGSARALGETLIVEGADTLTLLVAAATSFRAAGDPAAACRRRLDAAAARGYEELRARHVAEYRSYFGRMDLRLGGRAEGPEARGGAGPDRPAAEPTTEAALAAAAGGAASPGLVELYFHYGRYLLISSSRPGCLPANLQGIWNESFLPPWGSKFTINMNTQMNYWPAEPCGLGDCHLPLFEHLERMLPNGRRTAREMYGCRGFVAHHNTDLWGDCDPVDRWRPATIWPMGAAWLCLHVWQHYEYSLDADFLGRYYPIMKEACAFLLDFLTEDEEGRLVTNPSVSPENCFVLPGGGVGSMCRASAMDCQIVDALFSACGRAASVLGLDADFAARLEEARRRIPPPSIGPDGRLREWLEDREEAEPGHRHLSHLFALCPGDAIDPRLDPELAAAARASIERRLAAGSGHTGWSKAYLANLRARLGDGEGAWGEIAGLLARSTLPNLLDSHPPFQIDGNFGGAAAVVELLLRSGRGGIELLPALPSALPSGELRGARAKGGFEIDLSWEGNRLTRARIRSIAGARCAVLYRRPFAVRDGSGREVASADGSGPADFATAPGGEYHIAPAAAGAD